MGPRTSGSWPRTRLSDVLGTEFALIQAPMAGAASPELVAAVCAAGGLGSLGGGYSTPDALRDNVRAVRKLTDRPFAVNLMVHQRVGATDQNLDEQLDALESEGVPVFSFTFGIPPLDRLARMRRAGTVCLGTATTVAEAERLAEVGVDGVVAQGSEAGGHRGTFLGPFEDALIGTIALVPQVVDAVGGSVPVVAAGGIMDGRGVAAAVLLGADGVQLGTAFLTAAESATDPEMKKAVLDADETRSRITAAYTGRHARALATELLDELVEAGDVAPFPDQFARIVDTHRAAVAAGDRERMVVYAGQGTRLSTTDLAGVIVERLIRDSVALLSR